MARALTVLRLAPIAFVAAIGLLSALGLAGAWAVAQNATPLSVVLWMLPSVVVGALFTIYGTALLQGSVAGSNADMDRKVLWRQGRILLAIFAIFALTVSIAGTLYVSDLRTTVRHQRLDEQSAIASLKAQFIQKWLVERSIDAQLLASAVGHFPLDRPGLTRDDVDLIEVIFAESLAGLPDRMAIMLLAADGRVVANVGEAIPPGDIAQVLAAAGGPAGNQPRIYQRHASRTAGALRLDFVVPLRVSPNPAAAVFLVVAVDPAVGLLPGVKRWPNVSPSSEVELVRRDGDSVAFVSAPIREPGDRQLALPLSEAAYIEVQAVLDGDGVREGNDYRGVHTLSASRRIQGVDWQVIAKTDVTEALMPIDHRARLVTWLTIGAILVAAATSFGLWRADKASYLALRQRHEQERSALSRHYEQMMKHARDIVLLLDAEQRIIDANVAAVTAYRYSLEELRSMHAADLRAESVKAKMATDWSTMLAIDAPFETVHRRKDGSEFPVEVTGGYFDVEQKRYLQGFIRDISQRKRLEAEVTRLLRVQTALQTAAGLLLRAQNEDELYQGMCQVLINVGGYRLANVALANQDAGKSVRIAAIAGHNEGYLEQAAISWGEGPHANGPTGAAIRTSNVQINQNFASNPVMVPWRAEALKRSLRSSIGLPLRDNDRVFGALTIYSEQPFAFNKEEVGFLVQFAADISYGVGLLRSRRD